MTKKSDRAPVPTRTVRAALSNQLAVRVQLLDAEGPHRIGTMGSAPIKDRPAAHEIIADVEQQLGDTLSH